MISTTNLRTPGKVQSSDCTFPRHRDCSYPNPQIDGASVITGITQPSLRIGDQKYIFIENYTLLHCA